MRQRFCGSEEEAEGGYGGTAMFPAHGRHDGHRAWRGPGTCGAMLPAGGGMTLLDMMGMWKWVCDLVWDNLICNLGGSSRGTAYHSVSAALISIVLHHIPSPLH